jgi:two-component system response regulator FlrC
MLARYAQDRPLSLGAEAEMKLLQHRWQGNVRELDNCIQRAAILCAGKEVGVDDIYFEDDFSPDTARSSAGEAANEPEPLLNGGLKDKEKQMIVNALETVDGSRKDAAKLLGISPRTLRYKLARLKEQGVAIPAVG